MYEEWKDKQLDEYHLALLSMGFVPEAAERFTGVLREQIDTAYQYGLKYNEETD